MTQRLEGLSAIEAGDAVVVNRSADRNRRLRLLLLHRKRRVAQGQAYLGDKIGKLGGRHGVVLDVGRNNIRRKAQNFAIFHSIAFSYCKITKVVWLQAALRNNRNWRHVDCLLLS